MSQRAPFIVLEGPEGAGKSVQAANLAETLRKQGWNVLTTREPGGTPAGDAIRQILLQSDDFHLDPRTEALLMSASRAQHVQELIRPNLEAGTLVICDRYMDSTYAYQGGGHQLPLPVLEEIQQFAIDGLEPDIRLLLDLRVEAGLARRHSDASTVNRIDRAPLEFHQRVRATYLQIASADSSKWDIIDASRSINDVAAQIEKAVTRRLSGWPNSGNREVEGADAK